MFICIEVSFCLHNIKESFTWGLIVTALFPSQSTYGLVLPVFFFFYFYSNEVTQVQYGNISATVSKELAQ